MMKDPRINASAGHAIAYTAWAIALTLLITTWIIDDRRVAATGLFFAGIAVTATVRTYVVDMVESVRNAFELGRDSVTPMRRT